MVRNIVCFGDSNTYGYCGDPKDCTDGFRFNEEERWTCLLQSALGNACRVFEEGVVGRTTAFDDPLRDGMNGLQAVSSRIAPFQPVDLLIFMLGTNDTKARFGLKPAEIAEGMEKLVLRAKEQPVWGLTGPKILIIAPPHISKDRDAVMHEKSSALADLYREVARRNGCAFLDAEGDCTFNHIDRTHLTAASHRALAERLARMVPTLLKKM